MLSTYKALNSINIVPIVGDLVHQLVEELGAGCVWLEVRCPVAAHLRVEQLGKEPLSELRTLGGGGGKGKWKWHGISCSNVPSRVQYICAQCTHKTLCYVSFEHVHCAVYGLQ